MSALRVHRSPVLPGNRTRETVTYRDPADRLVEIDRAVLQRNILAALAHGPLWKWQLREALHIDEQVIYRELQVLRHAGQVKAFGQRLADRRWALIGYQPPPKVPIVKVHTAIAKTPEPPKVSWWIGLTREDFQKQLTRGQTTGDPPSSRTASKGGAV